MVMTGKSKLGSAIAIGNFDGFHLGHQLIVSKLKTIALEKDLESLIVTFKPNAKVFFHKQKHLINTDGQKKVLLENEEVDRVSVIHFPDVKDMTDEQFLEEVLIGQYRMKHIVMGENFRFGKRREGDIRFLKDASRRWGFSFTVVKPVMLEGVQISSSLIRDQLMAGQVELSGRMLGRRYFIEGIVAEGHRVGRRLGYPTINLDTPNTILPAGVYQTEVEIGPERFASISYIGYRPTFNGKEKKVECHIFDFDREVYGESVRLFFQRRLRGDMKFDDKAGLAQQIKKDIDNIKIGSKIELNVDKGTIF
jgi:riboflavin kinase/FMN adenylyltransferase